MSRILVTGGAGFIGSHIAENLLSEGYEVRALDSLRTGSLENIEDFRNHDYFDFFQGDIRDDNLEEVIKDVDVVFHEAAVTSVPESVRNPELTNSVNLEGTEKVLEACDSEGVNRLIFASTCAVYGGVEDPPITEGHDLNPDSPYAESKVKAEEKCRKYNREGSIETVILRYFNVYGPRQGRSKYSGVITKFIEKFENDEVPVIYGDGRQTRDFVYVDDVVRANLLALEGEGVSGRTFNVGSGRSVSINKLFEIISGAFDVSDVEPTYRDGRAGDIRHSESDLTRAKKDLGFEPRISLGEGVKRYINWRKRN